MTAVMFAGPDARSLNGRGRRRWGAYFVKRLSRTELEQLAAALEAILAGEGSPLPPLTAP